MINPQLQSYIEEEILPRYEHFDKAHRLDHINVVIAQSLKLSEYYDVNPDVVYTAAAYHDTGMVDGRELHHLASGRIIRNDSRLREWLTPEEIETAAQAAEDHRASSKNEPRSIYGRILADADRQIDPDTIIIRTLQYGQEHYPKLDKKEQIDRAIDHLYEKYGRKGYLRLWIPESDNAVRLEQLRRLLDNPEALREIVSGKLNS